MEALASLTDVLLTEQHSLARLSASFALMVAGKPLKSYRLAV